MTFLKTLTPCEFVALANIAAFTIARDTDSDDLEILGNFISLVGDIVSSIASQEQVQEELEEKKKQIEELESQIKDLKKKL